MHLKGIEPCKREFVCKAITLGYFRVHQFRSIFLAQVSFKTHHDKEIGQDLDEEYTRAQAFVPTVNEVMDSIVPANHSNAETIDKFFDW